MQEFETKLEECLAVRDDLLGQEDGAAGDSPVQTNAQKSKTKSKPTRSNKGVTRGGRAGRGRRNASPSDESEDSDFENRSPVRRTERQAVSQAPRTPTTRSTRKPTAKVIEDSDSSGMKIFSCFFLRFY